MEPPSPKEIPYPPAKWFTRESQDKVLEKAQRDVVKSKDRFDARVKDIKTCESHGLYDRMTTDAQGRSMTLWRYLNLEKEKAYQDFIKADSKYYSFFDSCGVLGVRT